MRLDLLSLCFRPRRSRSAAAYVIKLSRERSVGRSVGRSIGLSVQCIVEKRHIASGSRLAPQVGWVHGRGRCWGLPIGPREGVLLGAHLDRTIVTCLLYTSDAADE